MTWILGISALYHDSAACLVRDGEIVAAVQEERLTRIKHDPSFPVNAIQSCLDMAGIGPKDLDCVTFYEKPLLRFDRLIETYLRFAPKGFQSFFRATGALVNGKLSVSPQIDKALGKEFVGPIYYVRHHQAHAASAFLPSPFPSAAIITADGVGEWTTTSIGQGSGNSLSLLKEVHFPHSLGLLYSAFTGYIGFMVNSGEYKLMGLAPYGKPTYEQVIRDHLIDLHEDGSFHLNMRYFDYAHGMRMFNQDFCDLFGGPARTPDQPVTQRHMDVAASIQAVTEEAMLRLARHAHTLTGSQNLCLAGGVALNCVANGRILREGPFKNIWIQPASGDAGGALGAALFTWHQILGNARVPNPGDSQKGSLLGPSFSTSQIQATLHELGAPATHFADPDQLDRHVAQLLDQGTIVGWFQDRMEYGPRALCSRSILADARKIDMQHRVNIDIKYREGFRPFAPVVLREEVSNWFDLDCDSPYMLLVAQVAGKQLLPVPEGQDELPFLDRLWLKRSTIPAVTHVDNSARIQTCDAARAPRMHRLLTQWFQLTGCPVLLNTSFNVRGEPIVCTPKEAYATFMNTQIGALVMGDFLIMKDQQPAYSGPKRNFKPD